MADTIDIAHRYVSSESALEETAETTTGDALEYQMSPSQRNVLVQSDVEQ